MVVINIGVKDKMEKYDKWLINELKENHENMWGAVIPLGGWIFVIYIMSFHFPIKYLIKKSQAKVRKR